LFLSHGLLPRLASGLTYGQGLDDTTPSLPARYGRSSLSRRAGIPPLCPAGEEQCPPASVLSASRVFRLRLSLCIGATGSKVPCLSPVRARAALRPGAVAVADKAPPPLLPGPI